MRLMLGAAVAAASLLATGAAHAGQYADAMSKCIVSATTQEDRKAMGRWLFVALAASPELRPMTNISETQRATIARDMAALMERLLTEKCRAESLDALYYEGFAAFGNAFKAFGESAGEQLFGMPGVDDEIDRMAKFIDSNKLEAMSKELGRRGR